LLLKGFGDIPADFCSGCVVGFLGADDHSELSTGLNRKGLFDPLESFSDRLEFFHPLDVPLERLASSARPRSAACVGGSHKECIRELGGQLVVVTECCMNDMFIFAGSLEQIRTDFGVTSLELMVGGLSDVVQESATAGNSPVQTDHFGHHPGEERDLDRVA